MYYYINNNNRKKFRQQYIYYELEISTVNVFFMTNMTYYHIHSRIIVGTNKTHRCQYDNNIKIVWTIIFTKLFHNLNKLSIKYYTTLFLLSHK